jgi:hypothetical protein
MGTKKKDPYEALREQLATDLQAKSKLVGDLIEKKEHPFLAAGSQSIVLKDGHNQVLLVAPYRSATNIELLRKNFQKSADLPFHLPELVALNRPLNELIHPHNASFGGELKTSLMTSINTGIWQNNVVYRLPRYENNLEALKNIRFKAETIVQIQNDISKALETLHSKDLTHNDIALRNIFYTGSLPNFKFYLGDFGSVKQSKRTTQGSPQKDLDFHKLNLVIKKLEEILKTKTPSPKKRQPLLMQFESRSPIKLPGDLDEGQTLDFLNISREGKRKVKKRLKYH